MEFDTEAGIWIAKTDQGELEWSTAANTWIPRYSADQQVFPGLDEQPVELEGMDELQQQQQINKKRKRDKKKKDKNAPAKQNSSVFITGLPVDTKVEEVIEYFNKCGIIKKDEETLQYKVKVYPKEDGAEKVTGLVTYFRPESVPLAINLLDDTEFKPGFVIKVAEASFEHKKGQGGQKKKGKPSKKKKKLYNQEQELGWEDKESRIVVIKHLFHPSEAKEDPFTFFEDLKNDIEIEAGRCGEIQTVRIFENNPDGVVIIKFKTTIAAEKCINLMNGRWFAKKQLIAEYYDGFTNYEVRESDEQEEERIKKWHAWLEAGNEDKQKKAAENKKIEEEDDD
eukprot:TRINITY_DN12494_c0_g1_i1.p1 TRINITY_DN12494_c0_g1~~TRINITY_DN12494_c0_g1_i1.p1  ORF type:complete len:366 (-),score=108.07 TRINITY_DN12494_c0_g1_i1:24-1040(-)